jgi:hypothetical protein
MPARVRDRLSYANVISTLALFLVLSGGTAIALSGTNTVDSGDIINGQVRGTDVKESSLGIVPNSRKVGGLKAKTLIYRVNAGAADKPFSFPGGLTLTAKCSAGGDLSVTAKSGKDNSSINENKQREVGADGIVRDRNFDKSAGFSVVNPTDDIAAAVLTYVSPATAGDQGSLTTITYQASEDGFGAPDTKDCVFAGTALSRLL